MQFSTFFAQLLVFLLARLYAGLIFSHCEVYLKITGVLKYGWQTQNRVQTYSISYCLILGIFLPKLA